MLSLTVALTLVGLQPAQPKADAPGFGIPAETKSYWPLLTLTSESVQKELKFTDDQVKAAEKVKDDLAKQLAAAEKLQAAAATRAHADIAKKTDLAIDALLTAEQKRRYRQITWQVVEHATGLGGMMTNPVFAKELGFTDVQKRAVAKIAKDRDAALLPPRKGPPAGGGTNPPPGGGVGQAQPPMTPDEIKAKSNELFLKVLTSAQKEKWDDVTGEAFLQKIEMPRGSAPFSPPTPKK